MQHRLRQRPDLGFGGGRQLGLPSESQVVTHAAARPVHRIAHRAMRRQSVRSRHRPSTIERGGQKPIDWQRRDGKLRAHSSVGQSARFTSARSQVQVLLRPPARQRKPGALANAGQLDPACLLPRFANSSEPDARSVSDKSTARFLTLAAMTLTIDNLPAG